jgi:hypothetical protein
MMNTKGSWTIAEFAYLGRKSPFDIKVTRIRDIRNQSQNGILRYSDDGECIISVIME